MALSIINSASGLVASSRAACSALRRRVAGIGTDREEIGEPLQRQFNGGALLWSDLVAARVKADASGFHRFFRFEFRFDPATGR